MANFVLRGTSLSLVALPQDNAQHELNVAHTHPCPNEKTGNPCTYLLRFQAQGSRHTDDANMMGRKTQNADNYRFGGV